MNVNTRALPALTGTFFVDDDMKLQSIQVAPDEYNRLLTNSILRAVKWLNNNVLIQEDDGYFIRRRIKQGIIFNDEINKYLINSYSYWNNRLADKKKLIIDNDVNHIKKLSICDIDTRSYFQGDDSNFYLKVKHNNHFDMLSLSDVAVKIGVSESQIKNIIGIP